MAQRSAFVDHLVDLVSELGPARSRAMFGGFGIWLDERIVAIVVDDELYLKVDDENRHHFEEAGGRPFTYDKKGEGVATMGYWTVPGGACDDAESLTPWIRLAEGAAIRAATKKPARKATATRR